jgi:hypothetical protein
MKRKKPRYHVLRTVMLKGIFRDPRISMLPFKKASPKPKAKSTNSSMAKRTLCASGKAQSVPGRRMPIKMTRIVEIGTMRISESIRACA